MRQNISRIKDNLKGLQQPMEKFLFPLLLLLWPLAAVNQGVNVMDSTYSLGNYRYGDSVGVMWHFATYLANCLGELFDRTPFGKTMLGMNFLTGLLVSVTALAVYYVLKRMMPGWMIFLGEWIAISLCWCPTVILYNYLTYLLLTLACLFLFLAETSVPRSPRWFVLAGICLGLNVMVRFSNAPQCLLILAVWYYAWITKQEASQCRKDTLFCILGYILGFGIPLLVILIRYGAGVYAEMIQSLFGMTSQASDYTMAGMLFSILDTYVHTGRWMAIMAAGTVMGTLFLLMPIWRRYEWAKRLLYVAGVYAEMIQSLFGMTSQASDYTMAGMLFSILDTYVHTGRWMAIMAAGTVMGTLFLLMPIWRRYEWAKRLLYVAGIVLMIRFFYGRGMFTVNYQDYWCMFQWGMCLVILAWAVCLAAMGGVAAATVDERFLAAMTLLLLLITPIGSNNYTFPLLNNLFFIGPFTLWMLRRFWQHTRYRREHGAWHIMAIAILVMVLVQGSLFHVCFAFRDGTDGTKRSEQVTGNTYLAGMQTTPANAAALSGLSEATKQYGLTGKKLLTFGNVPGLHVILGMEPALSNTWPDLDSYPVEQLREDLAALDAEEVCPVIIIGKHDSAMTLEEPDTPAGQKAALLTAYMEEGAYSLVYENEEYALYMNPAVGAR